MAFLKNFKSCLLLSSEIQCSQLLFPIHQSLSLQVYGSPSLHGFQNGIRFYQRFHRKPVRVNPAKKDEGKMLLGDYVDKTNESANQEVLQETKRLAQIVQPAVGVPNAATQHHRREEQMLLNNDWKEVQVSHPSKNDDRKKVFQHDPAVKKILDSIKYEHLYKAPSQFRSLLSQCCSRKLRHRHDLVLLEGIKLIQEALTANILPVAVFYSRKNLLLKIMPKTLEQEEKVEKLNSMNIFALPYKKMTTWSSVVTGQGIMGVFKLSDVAQAYKLKQNTEDHVSKSFFPLRNRVTLVLDSVKEPGNVGALIRTAAAAGVDKVVLIKEKIKMGRGSKHPENMLLGYLYELPDESGSCDPWKSKTLRAGCGGHLTVEVCEKVPWSRIYTTVARYPSVYLADISNSDREPLRDYDTEEDDSHPEGLDRVDTRGQKDEVLKKVFKGSTSKEMSLVKRAEQLDEDDEDNVSSDESEEFFGKFMEVQEDGSEQFIDNSFLDVEHLNQFADAELPLSFINEIDFFSPNTRQSQNIVLVVGGETGLSVQAKKFAHDNFGSKISIPLHNGVDSLNTSVASGVILYEMWNQFQKVQALCDDGPATEQVQGAKVE